MNDMSRVAQKDTSRKGFSIVIENLKSVVKNLFGSGDQPSIDSLEAYANNPKNANAEDVKTAQALLASLKGINEQEKITEKSRNNDLDNLKYDVPGIDGTKINNNYKAKHARSNERDGRE